MNFSLFESNDYFLDYLHDEFHAWETTTPLK